MKGLEQGLGHQEPQESQKAPRALGEHELKAAGKQPFEPIMEERKSELSEDSRAKIEAGRAAAIKRRKVFRRQGKHGEPRVSIATFVRVFY